MQKKYDDEDAYTFYSVDEYIKKIYSRSAQEKSVRFISDSKKIIIKFTIKDIEKCNYQIIGTSVQLGISVLYRSISNCETSGNWKPLDISATRNVVAGIRIEMYRYEISYPYEIMIYLPLLSKIEKMEVGVLHNSILSPTDLNEAQICLLGNISFENGINTPAYYLPHIISRKTHFKCDNYSGNIEFDIKKENKSALNNIRFFIMGVHTDSQKIDKALSDATEYIEYITEYLNGEIIIFKSPLICYNNYKVAQKVNDYFDNLTKEDKYNSRVHYLKMIEFEEPGLLFDCTLSCNFLNDYGYVCLGKSLSEKINELEVINNV